MWNFLKSIWGGITTVLGWIWTAIKAVASATTWPARWVIAKAQASSIGLRIWAWSIDPPAVRGIYLVALCVLLPLLGAIVDRTYVRGDEIAARKKVEAQVRKLSRSAISLAAEKLVWEQRAVTAEAKYDELVKRDPPSSVAPVLEEKKAKPAPRRAKRKPANTLLYKPTY